MNFWAEKHKANDILYLTGSDLHMINSYMQMELKKHMYVLNIGVGMGVCTRQLSELTKNLYVLDICQEAVDKVKDCIREGYVHPELIPENKFDLIISHLVTQHIDKEELFKHLKYGIAGLKPEGEFVIQIAVPIDRSKEDESNMVAVLESGSKKYDIIEIIEMVLKCNGKVSTYKKYNRYEQYNMDWYIFHIQKGLNNG